MKNRQPPKLANQALRFFCSEELIEEIEGDLHEAYLHRHKLNGVWHARLLYWLDVIRFFKPYSFEKYSRSKQFLPMVNNYFKIASRNLLKRKGLTTINLLGLSLGISSMITVVIYLQYELDYDQHNPDAERIFRLVNDYRDQTYTCMSFVNYNDTIPSGQLKLINFLEDYEEVESACQFVPNLSAIGPDRRFYLTADGKEYIVDDLLYTNTGQQFQKIFPQKFIQGSPENAFSQFQTITISSSLAERLFAANWREKQLVNKTIRLGDATFTIGGVIEDLPGNMHFQFEAILHQATIPSWGSYTYVKLTDPSLISQIMNRFNQEVDLVYPGRSEDDLQKGTHAIALTDIHFTNDTLYEIKPTANMGYLLTFAVVGLIILLIIWTNYTNSTMATYANRQKELGLRKTLGARSGDIANQVVVEAVLITFISLPISWLLVYLFVPQLNELLEIKFDRMLLFQPLVIVALVLFVTLTGVISSLYPSLYYSRKTLLPLLQGKLSGAGAGSSKWGFRNALLTSQFLMLVVLVSITLIIQQQMNYVQNKALGFEPEGVVYFDLDSKEKFDLLKQKIVQLPEVEAIGTGAVPGQDLFNQLTYKMRGEDETFADGTVIYTTKGAFDVLGITSDAFRNMGERGAFVINRTAASKLAKSMGINEANLIGQTLITEPEWENEMYGFGVPHVIAGIIEDFDFFNLKHTSQPLLIEVRNETNYVYNMLIKLNTDDWITTITSIERAYAEVEQEVPFNLSFLDNHLSQLYRKEKNAGILTYGLTGVSLGLAIMGLISIVGFIALSRRKEIGVRKVFGASVGDILVLLNKDYVVMMLIAVVIAMPIVNVLADEWLSSFAYHIDPGVETVFLAGLCTLLIVLSVVIIQTLRTANLNPTEAITDKG